MALLRSRRPRDPHSGVVTPLVFDIPDDVIAPGLCNAAVPEAWRSFAITKQREDDYACGLHCVLAAARHHGTHARTLSPCALTRIVGSRRASGSRRDCPPSASLIATSVRSATPLSSTSGGRATNASSSSWRATGFGWRLSVPSSSRQRAPTSGATTCSCWSTSPTRARSSSPIRIRGTRTCTASTSTDSPLRGPRRSGEARRGLPSSTLRGVDAVAVRAMSTKAASGSC